MRTLLLIFLLFFAVTSVQAKCVITMGYRLSERLPLIEQAPDNDGLYHDLYYLAASHIGCRLDILRGSKTQLMKSLKKGRIDFYPALTYTQERSEYLLFIANGLPGGEVAVTRLDHPEIKSWGEMAGKTLLVAQGGANYQEYSPDVKLLSPVGLDTPRAIQLVMSGYADLFVYNENTIRYYLKNNPELKDKVKIHPECCGGEQPMYLGFSHRSRHFAATANPEFTPESIKGPFNQRWIPDPRSIAGRFAAELIRLKQNRFTDVLYNDYYR